MTRITSPRASHNLIACRGGMVAAAMLALSSPVLAASIPPPPPPGAPVAASLVNADGSPAVRPPDTAAIVNGHTITLSQVTETAMRQNGADITSNLIDIFLVDSECKKRNLVIPQALIDDRVDGLRKAIAPSTLEEGLKQHHETMDMLRDEMRISLEKEDLVLDKIQPTHIVNCKAILVRFTGPNIQQPTEFPPHSEAEALKILDTVQKELKSGKDFGDVAKQYSEDTYSKDKSGEVGLAFDGANIDQSLIKAALTLESGQTTPAPVKVSYGYYIIKVVSTSEKHPKDEDSSYNDAEDKYRRQQAQYMIPEYLKTLRAAAKIYNYLPQ